MPVKKPYVDVIGTAVLVAVVPVLLVIEMELAASKGMSFVDITTNVVTCPENPVLRVPMAPETVCLTIAPTSWAPKLVDPMVSVYQYSLLVAHRMDPEAGCPTATVATLTLPWYLRREGEKERRRVTPILVCSTAHRAHSTLRITHTVPTHAPHTRTAHNIT